MNEKTRDNYLLLKLDFIQDTGEKCLFLRGMNLNEIPNEILNLEHLEHLDLGQHGSHNRVETPKLRGLKILGKIDPDHGVKIGKGYKATIIERIGQYQDFSDHEKQNLKDELYRYFRYEIANNKRHSSLPFFGDNSIEKIPSKIGSLKNLKTLNLIGNELLEVPNVLLSCENLEKLYLYSNPIKTPPAEIAIENDKDDNNLNRIRKYFEAIDEYGEIDYLFEVKLILLGEERSGKTSIAKALSDENFIFDKNQKSTEGIAISNWILNTGERNSRQNFKINIWDFGGQEIYHATHQFFLTKRSIYFLITESRKDIRHEDFYYWLNIIEVLGGNSPIVILINKSDQPNVGFAIEEYKERFKNIVDILKTSCKPSYKSTIDSLKQLTKSIINNKLLLPDIGMPLPSVWIKIRKEIEHLRKEESYYYMSLKKYLAICENHGLNTKSANFLSSFFHDLGVFLHFKDDFELNDTIFLDFQWITKAVYNVLDNKKVISNNGIFDTEILNLSWREEPYRRKKHELLALMKNKKFELCFPLGKGKYLAPQLLSHNKTVEWENDWSELVINFKYKFLPKGVLSRLMVKMHREIQNNNMWRYGVILQYEKSFAFVREEYFDRKISVSMKGRDKKILFALIRKSLFEINENFNGLQVVEKIACPCSECKVADHPIFYDVKEDLERRIERGKRIIECNKSFESIVVRDLVSEIYTIEEEVKDNLIDSEIVNFVKQGDSKGAIDLLLNVLKEKSLFNVIDEVILIASKLNAFETKHSLGLITTEEYFTHVQKVNDSILRITRNFLGS